MSDDSQAERVWQYAMQGVKAIVDAQNTSPKAVADVKVDDGPSVSTDLSNSFGTIAPKLQFHGLAETQSETLDASDYLAEEETTEDRHKIPEETSATTKRSGNGPSKPKSLSGPIILEQTKQPTTKSVYSTILPSILENSHVTNHVTDAPPPRGAAPFVGPAVDVERTAGPPTHQEQIKEHDNKRLLQRNKASSFHVRPEEPSSPRPLKRINTMPPRTNRYAPRDIEPSSQDSFAGSPPRQDLNTFIKNSKFFNNLCIRPGVDGKPSEVFELPSTTDSSQMPPEKGPKATRGAAAEKGKAKKVQPQQAEQRDEPPSQLVRTAFAHGLVKRSPTPPSIPPPLPSPVVLVKDTQSDTRTSQDDTSGSKRYESGGEDMDVQSEEAHSESRAVETSPTHSSSSFVLPNVGAVEDNEESTQSTQPVSQEIPPDMIIISPHTTTLASAASRISSIPIPEYRRQEFAFLQNRFRNKDEIVPATPISTVPGHSMVAGPSVDASITQPNIAIMGNIDPPDKTKGKEKAQDVNVLPVRQERTKPASKPQSLRRSERAKTGPPSKDGTKRPQEIPNEIVPDSQEEQNSNTSVKIISDLPKPQSEPTRGELVPDSQEEEQQKEPKRLNPLSSPSIPLAQLADRRSEMSSSPSIPLLHTTTIGRMALSRFPTPTPAAVKSPLRKGRLPEGVTHTRGRGRPSTKPAQVEVEGEKEEDEEDEEEGSGREDDDMEVDAEEEDEDEETEKEKEKEKEPPRRKYQTTKRTRGTNSKPVKREGRSKKTQKTRRVIPAVTRKRKSDSKLEQQSSEVLSLPPSKRRRGTTPGPTTGVTQLSKRVLARCQHDSDYYHPGTVHLEFVSSEPTSGSGSFAVEFDDGCEELVNLDDMRSFQLEHGDVIDVAKSNKKGASSRYRRATVLDVDNWEDEVAQVHDVEGGPDGDDYDVNGKDVRVSEEQIQSQWGERCINLRTLCKDKEYDLPRRNKHLAGYAFIVTMPDLHKSKSSLQRIIELSGGIVCDWDSIVSLSGTSEVDGKRIIGKASDVRLVKSKVKLKNLFCVAEEPRTTPKFLIALALGVPCLSIDWILAKVHDYEIQFDWQAYILPAGINPVTKQAASQNFDRVWWRDTDNFVQLLSNSPVEKLFVGKSFLCIGSFFIPKSKEFGTFPKVLLAMGASVVHAITQLKYVKSQVKFDYTVVDDDDGSELLSYNGAPGVNISWIKKCLITGIEGPVPWPDI